MAHITLPRPCGRILPGVAGRTDDNLVLSSDDTVDGGSDIKELYSMLYKCLFYMLP